MDLARKTLAELSEHDWNQRYSHSLINYDSRIWFVSQCYGAPIKMRMKDISEGLAVDEDEDFAPKANPLQKAMDKVAWYQNEIQAYAEYIARLKLQKKLVDPEIENRYKELLTGQIRNNAFIVQANIAAANAAIAEIVPPKPKKLLHQDLRIDPNMINLERPRAGWYSFGDNRAGYLSYKAEKQFSRGFSLKSNCFIFSPITEFGWTDLSHILTAAYFGPRVTKKQVDLESFMAMKPKDHTLLSRQIIAQAHYQQKGMGTIHYRAKRIATYSEKGVLVSVPAFMDELREVLAFEPQLGVDDVR